MLYCPVCKEYVDTIGVTRYSQRPNSKVCKKCWYMRGKRVPLQKRKEK